MILIFIAYAGQVDLDINTSLLENFRVAKTRSLQHWRCT
jgi:hypothetical protein